MTRFFGVLKPLARPVRGLLLWLRGLLGLLSLLLSVTIGISLAALFWVLDSEAGTAWLLAQLPGLQVEQGRGTLWDGWHAAALQWQAEGVTLQVTQPVLVWSPACLWLGKLCIQQLAADQVRLDMAADDAPPAQIPLPDLGLPTGVTLTSLSLGQLVINGQEIGQQLLASGHLAPDQWQLDRVSGVFGGLFAAQSQAADGVPVTGVKVVASGWLRPSGDWPLALQTQLDLPYIPGQDWQLALSLSQSLQHLKIAGTSKGYLNARLTGSLAPLTPDLPLTLQARTDSLLPWAGLPESLRLVDSQISLAGNLLGEMRLAGQGYLGASEPQPFALDGLLSLSQLQIRQLTLGDNQIKGKLDWQEALRADLQLALPHLEQLLPDLSGSLTGQVTMAGSGEKPQLQGSLQVKNLQQKQSPQLRMAQADLSFRWEAAQQGQLQLKAQQLEVAGRKLGDAALELAGSLAAHHITLKLTDGQSLSALPLQLSVDGVVTASGWRGQLGPVDAAVIQQLLDVPLNWQGSITGEIDLQRDAGGPRGHIRLDAGHGEFGLPTRMTYDQLTLSAQLHPDQVTMAFDLQGPQLGKMTLTAHIDPQQKDWPIQGGFSLQALDASLLGAVLDIEQISGQLAGEGKLAGLLMKPQISGTLTADLPGVQDIRLPLPLADVHLNLQFTGEQAQMTGRWRSGEMGEGTLAGQASWAESPQVDLQLKAKALSIAVEPWGQLDVNPDLHWRYREGATLISGQIEVPRGQIKLRKLPPQAIRVSADARLVGAASSGKQQPEQQPGKQQLDVRLLIGTEVITLAGLGLTGKIRGQLRMGDHGDTRGELTLRDGRYEAYGQELTLRRARLVFAGPIDQPYLDVEAVRLVDDVTVGLRLSGLATAPVTKIFSQPTMPEQQALSYLILGRAPGAADDNRLTNAAVSMGLATAAPLTKRVGETVGIDQLALETAGTGNGTQVVASGYLSNKLSVRYGVGLFEPISRIALRYDLSRRVYLEAASGLASSLDIFYKRDF